MKRDLVLMDVQRHTLSQKLGRCQRPIHTKRCAPNFSSICRTVTIGVSRCRPRLSTTHASDEAYAAAAAVFAEKDLVDLTLVIAAMNAFNRLGAPFRLPVAAKP